MKKLAMLGAVAVTLISSSAFAQGVEFGVGPRGVYVGNDRNHDRDWRRDRDYRRHDDVVIRDRGYHRGWDRGGAYDDD